MSSRIDIWLVQNSFFESREKARLALEQGVVEVNGKIITKAAYNITGSDHVIIKAQPLRYVSRGGLKLEKAIQTFHIDFTNKVVLDIGASTGGFTDCALQHGAAKVFAVDVGSNQLHASLQHHPKVTWWENLNIKDLTPEMLGEAVDIITIDVSFTSLRPIFPFLLQFLKPDGIIITLIKPQFELEEKIRFKKGIVKDEQIRQEVLKKVTQAAEEQDFTIQKYIPTDADGQQKNVEYLAFFNTKKLH
ncbi:MAG: TlyA family RNA methyltransferase [Saprospiraceae bacterium]